MHEQRAGASPSTGCRQGGRPDDLEPARAAGLRCVLLLACRASASSGSGGLSGASAIAARRAASYRGALGAPGGDVTAAAWRNPTCHQDDAFCGSTAVGRRQWLRTRPRLKRRRSCRRCRLPTRCFIPLGRGRRGRQPWVAESTTCILGENSSIRLHANLKFPSRCTFRGAISLSIEPRATKCARSCSDWC